MQPGYARLLELARAQADAAARGDLDGAVALLDARHEIVVKLPRPGRGDAPVITEILRLDRDLSSRIRERMIEIRNEALDGQHGRVALAGYRPPLRRAAVAIDTLG